MPQLGPYPWAPLVAYRGVPLNLGNVPTWVVVNTMTYASFAAASTSNTVPLFMLPGQGIMHGFKIYPTQNFAGGSIGAYTVSVGDGINATAYAGAFDVHQATGPSVFQLSSDFAGGSLAGPTQIYCTATAAGANLSAATQGAVQVFALLSRVA